VRIASIVLGLLLFAAGATCFVLAGQQEESAVKWDQEATQLRSEIASGKRPKEFKDLPDKMDDLAAKHRAAAPRCRMVGGVCLALGVVFCALPFVLRRRKPTVAEVGPVELA
jgi:hypothetical protein